MKKTSKKATNFHLNEKKLLFSYENSIMYIGDACDRKKRIFKFFNKA